MAFAVPLCPPSLLSHPSCGAGSASGGSTSTTAPITRSSFVVGRRAISIVAKRPRGRCRTAACLVSSVSVSSDAEYYCVESGYWEWQGYGRVHYRHSGAGNEGPTVLFVPGFGCGAFHFEANVGDLARRGFRVYAMDKLGLGESTVADIAVARKITLELWRDQITAFMENVLLRAGDGNIFVVGNSLGGLLVASAAYERPDLFRGAVLLNAAPFWLSVPGGLLRDTFGYIVDNIWWNQLTKPAVLKNTLQLVYYKAVDPTLVQQILGPTKRALAKTIFRSILTTPPLPYDFDTALSDAFSESASTPLACINGLRDPWVTPLWGMRIKDRIPSATIYEIDPVGHCPHHEAPKTTDFLIAHWIRSILSEQPPATFGTRDAPVVLSEAEGIRVSTKTAPTSFWDRFANSYGVFGTFVLATLESIRL